MGFALLARMSGPSQVAGRQSALVSGRSRVDPGDLARDDEREREVADLTGGEPDGLLAPASPPLKREEAILPARLAHIRGGERLVLARCDHLDAGSSDRQGPAADSGKLAT